MQPAPALREQPLKAESTSHPRGLYVLFATEMWERFSYYGMRALLSLYMLKALLMNKEMSSLIYGNYTSLVYLTPLLGGYMADRYWGNRVTSTTGYNISGKPITIYSRSEGEVLETYKYDALNRLRSVTRDKILVDERKYDAADRVLAASSPAATWSRLRQPNDRNLRPALPLRSDGC